jgi:hypothetical protein
VTCRYFDFREGKIEEKKAKSSFCLSVLERGAAASSTFIARVFSTYWPSL